MKSRRPLKITGRISTVTNCFVQAIVPAVLPDPDEQQMVLEILKVDPSAMTCVYCGDPAQHWDHLYPYVKEKRPSGYLNESKNLVPACGPCNTSKSGYPWKAWMQGLAKGSPTSRGVQGIEDRIAKLESLEAAIGLKPRNLADYVDAELWQRYWAQLDEIEARLFSAQKDAEVINRQISAALKLKN